MQSYTAKTAFGGTLTITDTAISYHRTGRGERTILRSAFTGMEVKRQLWRYTLTFRGSGAKKIKTLSISKQTMLEVRKILGV